MKTVKERPIKYWVNGQGYYSKDAVWKEASRILNKYPLNTYLKPCNQDFDFILSMLSQHVEAEEKLGCGVVAFQIVHLGIYNQRRFDIVRSDNSRMDFSIKYCLASKKRSKYQLLQAALREVVQDQISAFRKLAYLPLEQGGQGGLSYFSKQYVHPEDAHIDHAAPYTFQYLIDKFLELKNIDVDSLSFTGAMLPELENIEIAKAFYSFHNANAHLRLLHKRENLMMPRNIPIFDYPLKSNQQKQ